MQEQLEKRHDLLLLLSVLLVILMHPVLDHGMIRRLVLTVLTLVPLVLATIKISKRKGWVLPLVVLISGSVICGIGGTIFSSELLMVLQWILLTGAFAVAVAGFSLTYKRLVQSRVGIFIQPPAFTC